MGGSVQFINAASEAKEMTFASHHLSIDVLKEVNRIPTAQIQLLDKEEADGETANADYFAPGQTIEIQICASPERNNSFESVFVGVVVKYAMRAHLNQTYLDITLKDVAVKLTAQRKSSVFQAMTDAAVIKEMIKPQKLTLGSAAKTPIKHAELVQYCCTDWDFMLSRAEANGLWVAADMGDISLLLPVLKSWGSPELVLRFPKGADPNQCSEDLVAALPGGQQNIYNISELEMEADIQHQYKAVSSYHWNAETQTLDPPSKKVASVSLDAGSVSFGDWSKALGSEACNLVAGAVLAPEESQAWAEAQMLKTRQSMFRGWVKGGGLPYVLLGAVVEITGVSDLFDGFARVSGIRHQAGTSGWQTSLQFGQRADWFWEQQPVSQPPASGLLPAVSGLQIGVVAPYEKDGDQQYRVRVRVPALANAQSAATASTDKTGSLIWARVAALDAGQARGSVFFPEEGDEVILGFLHDDPRQAVILGSVHSPKQKPPWEPEKENLVKGIVTKTGLKLTFDDTQDKSAIAIETPAGNKILLLDETKSIQLTDANANTIVLDDKGIHFKSVKDIDIAAPDGNITLTAGAVEVK